MAVTDSSLVVLMMIIFSKKEYLKEITMESGGNVSERKHQ